MLYLLLMLPQAQAERGWFARTFGPADDDEDGIPDRDDNCPTIAEQPNGYADGDGCPDYLSFVTVQATHGGRNLAFAEYWMKHHGKAYVANGPAMSLEDLIPGETVEVAARLGCLGGEGTARAGTDPVGIRLALYPERHTAVTVQVSDSSGSPLDARIIWTESSPAPCGPLEGRMKLPDGSGTTKVGVGTHAYIVQAGNKSFQGTLDVQDDQPATIQVVLEERRVGGAARLPERIHFASGQAGIDLRAKSLLDDVAAKLQAQPEMKLLVEGHADTRASNLYNETLAQRRADAVVRELLQRGISDTRLSTATRGESEPIEMGYSESAHAENRRVEFVVR